MTSSTEASFPKAIFLLAFAGVLALWFVLARWGIGLSPDSSGYLSAARGLLKGEGLVNPPTSHESTPMITLGPLFSILLAGIGQLGVDPLVGAGILNPLLFGASTVLVSYLTFYYTRSRWAAFVSGFFVLTSLVTLELHAMCCSEPVFIFFGFLGLFLLARFLEKRKFFLLFTASAALGLAFLAKYSGISFVLAGILAILFLSREAFGPRFVHAIVLGTLGSLPMGIWVVRNTLRVGQATELFLYFEPYVLGHFRQIAAYLSMWLLPESFPPFVRGIALLVFLLFLGFASFYAVRRQQSPVGFPGILWLVIVCHIGVYLFTTIFFGEQPFDNRALSPVFVAGLVLVVGTVNSLWRFLSPHSLTRGLLALAVLVFAVSYLARGAVWAAEVKREGLGFAGREWKTSETIQRVKTLPSEILIYTNGGDVVYLLTGRSSLGIPAKEEVLKVHIPDRGRRLVPSYPLEFAKMRKDLREKDGVLVYLRKIRRRWYLPSEEELVQTVPLGVFEKFDDGTIYKVRS